MEAKNNIEIDGGISAEAEIFEDEVLTTYQKAKRTFWKVFDFLLATFGVLAKIGLWFFAISGLAILNKATNFTALLGMIH